VAERHTRSLVPRQNIIVGGEDESYFANLEMQVSIPAAALELSSSGRRLRQDARKDTVIDLFPGEFSAGFFRTA
jgi:hypothetical protein